MKVYQQLPKVRAKLIAYWTERNRRLSKEKLSKGLKLKSCHICKTELTPESMIDAGKLYCRPCYAKEAGMTPIQTYQFLKLKSARVKVDASKAGKILGSNEKIKPRYDWW
jgi:hypothetical protein